MKGSDNFALLSFYDDIPLTLRFVCVFVCISWLLYSRLIVSPGIAKAIHDHSDSGEGSEEEVEHEHVIYSNMVRSDSGFHDSR